MRIIEFMVQVHMTEAEVASDFAAVLRKVGHGEEVVVDRDGQAVAVIKAADGKPRTLSELIELAGQREKERGHAITLDEDYAADVERIVRERKPWTPSFMGLIVDTSTLVVAERRKHSVREIFAQLRDVYGNAG